MEVKNARIAKASTMVSRLRFFETVVMMFLSSPMVGHFVCGLGANEERRTAAFRQPG